MIRKSVLLILVFYFSLGLERCLSPEKPEEPEQAVLKYMYHVEVIYARKAIEYPESEDHTEIWYYLYDPAFLGQEEYKCTEMNRIDKNKFRCYLPKVFVQTLEYNKKHRLCVFDLKKRDLQAENIVIQGAYDLEITKFAFGAAVHSELHFRMSKEY